MLINRDFVPSEPRAALIFWGRSLGWAYALVRVGDVVEEIVEPLNLRSERIRHASVGELLKWDVSRPVEFVDRHLARFDKRFSFGEPLQPLLSCEQVEREQSCPKRIVENDMGLVNAFDPYPYRCLACIGDRQFLRFSTIATKLPRLKETTRFEPLDRRINLPFARIDRRHGRLFEDLVNLVGSHGLQAKRERQQHAFMLSDVYFFSLLMNGSLGHVCRPIFGRSALGARLVGLL